MIFFVYLKKILCKLLIFSSTNNNEVPLFVLQYPDGSLLSSDSIHETNKHKKLTNSVSVELKKTTLEQVENQNGGVEIMNETKHKHKNVLIINKQVWFT